MATPAAVLSILVKAQGVQTTAGQLKGLDAAGRSASKGMATAESSAKRSSKTFSVMGTAAKSAGLLVGVAGLAAGAKVMVSEFREAQKVGAQTNAVLKSTGRQAGVTKKHIEDLAGAISRKSGIDDEQIQASENLLLTFTKLRNETGKGNKIFDQATQIVTDMSVALGQSGKSSAIQLGKALQDPIKGITALRRVGVNFNAQQSDQIKKMVESGDLLGAQKRIIKELKTEFGGSAAAQATAGDKLKVSLGNLAEAAGGVLVPALDKVARWFTKVIDQFVEGKGIAKVIIARFVELGTALLPFAESVKQIVGWLQKHNDVAKILIITLGGLAAAIAVVNIAMAANPFVLAAVAIAALVVGVVTAYREFETFRKIVDGAVKVVGTIAGALAMAGAAVGSAFTSMVAWVSGAMDTVTAEIGKWHVAAAVVSTAVTMIQGYVQAAMTATVAVVRAALTLLAPLFTAAFGVIKAVVTGAFAAIKAIVAGGLQVIRGIVQVFGGILKGDFGQIWEGVKNIFRGVGAAIAGILRAQLATVKAAGSAMGKGLLDGFKAALNLAHELAVAMRDLIAKAPGFALGVGKAIVSGIISGIKSAAGGIGNAIKGAVGSAAGAINPFGEGIGKKLGIVPMKAPGSLMGARPSLAPFAAVGAANGLRVSSGLRRGAVTSSGNTSYHSTGEAVDLAGPPAGMLKTFRTLRSRFGSKLAELIHTPGGAGIKDGKPFVYTGKVAADHFDHVHVAFDSGKPGLGDGLGRASGARKAMTGDGTGKYSLQQLADLWVKAGGDPKVAGLMARIAQAESGGNPSARNPSGATGLWQILGAMVKGSLTNPLVNAKNAVAKLKSQGLGAWAASKASWGKYADHPGVTASRGGGSSGGGGANIPALKKQISQNLDKLDKLRSQVRDLPTGKKGADKRKALQNQISVLLAKNRHIRDRISASPAVEKVSKFEMAQAVSDVALASAASTPAVADDILANTTLRDATTTRIKEVRKALKNKNLRPATRLRLTQELGGLVGKHTELQGTLKDLRTKPGFDALDKATGINDARLSIAQGTESLADDLGPLQEKVNILGKVFELTQKKFGAGSAEAAQAFADLTSASQTLAKTQRDALYQPFQQMLTAGSAQLTAAQVFTPGDTSDDLVALNNSLGVATQAFLEAVNRGDVEAINEFGGQVLSLRGSIEQLSAQVEQNTQAMLDLVTQQRDDARKAANVSQSQYGVLAKAIADVASGQIGGRVGLGFMSPSFPGGGSRY